MKDKDLGKVMLTPEGSWVATRSYERLSAVEYNGSGYISLKSSYGIEPGTDPTVWALFVLGGTPDITTDTDGNIYVDGEIISTILAQAKIAEVARNNAEAKRSESENARAASETRRTQAEEKRVYNETLRSNAESTRRSAESARGIAEKERGDAELIREEREQRRVSNEVSRGIAMSGITKTWREIRNETISIMASLSGGLKSVRRRVVIGRAIPADTWEKGVSYFNSESIFTFKVRGTYNKDRKLIYVNFNPFAYEYIRDGVFFSIGYRTPDEQNSKMIVKYAKIKVQPEHTVTSVKFDGEKLDIIDQSEVILFIFVDLSKQEADRHPNVLFYTGAGIIPYELKDCEGTSRYLSVQNGRIICEKLPNGEKSTVVKRKKCSTRRCKAARKSRVRRNKFQRITNEDRLDSYKAETSSGIKRHMRLHDSHTHVIRRYARHRNRYVSRIYEEIAI